MTLHPLPHQASDRSLVSAMTPGAHPPDHVHMPPRLRSLVALVAVLATPVVLANIAPSAAYADVAAPNASRSATAALDLGIIQQLNEIRTEHGLKPLTLDPSLSAAAMAHSRDMVDRGYFAHRSSDGQPFWKRIMTFYPAGNFGYWAVGENLYWSSGFPTADDGMQAWMASPEHRKNILDPTWTQIGIATVVSPDAPGPFNDLGVTVITTDFGVRHD